MVRPASTASSDRNFTSKFHDLASGNIRIPAKNQGYLTFKGQEKFSLHGQQASLLTKTTKYIEKVEREMKDAGLSTDL